MGVGRAGICRGDEQGGVRPPKMFCNFCHSAIQRKILTLWRNQEAKDCFRKCQMQISVNKSTKGFILRVKPELVISGHLYENARKEDEVKK